MKGKKEKDVSEKCGYCNHKGGDCLKCLFYLKTNYRKDYKAAFLKFNPNDAWRLEEN